MRNVVKAHWKSTRNLGQSAVTCLGASRTMVENVSARFAPRVSQVRTTDLHSSRAKFTTSQFGDSVPRNDKGKQVEPNGLVCTIDGMAST